MVRSAWLTERTERELDVALRLVNDATIHELNRDFRDKDKATDVLAFAQREGPAGDLFPELLGDIVISVETAARQAKSTLHDELVFLAAHGLCHLLGYDHQDDLEETAMNERMTGLIAASAGEGDVAPA
jgi:probable rRNA maturation factor